MHTLVYAAGPHVPMMHLSRVTPAQFRQQLEQDAVGFFNLVSPALPYLRETRGSLVAVGQRAVGGETIIADLKSSEMDREARAL